MEERGVRRGHSLDREKRKASRDKGQYDAGNVSYKSEASKLKDS